MFERVRWRLLAWTLLVLVLILALVGTAVYVSLQRRLTAEVDQNLASSADDVAMRLNHFGIVRIDSAGYRGGLFYLIIAPNGRILDNPQHVDVSTLPLASPVGDTPSYATLTLDGIPVRLYLVPLTPVGNEQAVLVAGQSMVAEQQALNGLLLVLIGSALAGLVLSFAGAWFLVGRSLVPIQRAYARQQEFAADAAHELRTPLTVLHAATDVLHQHRDEPLAANAQLFDDVRHEIVRMEHLAGDLLTLARSDLGELELEVASVDLAAIAVKVVRQIAPLAQERCLDVSTELLETSVELEADPNRLQQLLLILLDNAIKHTPQGGHVSVRLSRHGNEALMEVCDTGEGIPPEHLARIFDRFYRVDAARSRDQGGTGLGLAIATSLVRAHGGQLTLASTVGVGTTASVRLPLGARPTALGARFGRVAARLAHPLH